MKSLNFLCYALVCLFSAPLVAGQLNFNCTLYDKKNKLITLHKIDKKTPVNKFVITIMNKFDKGKLASINAIQKTKNGTEEINLTDLNYSKSTLAQLTLLVENNYINLHASVN